MRQKDSQTERREREREREREEFIQTFRKGLPERGRKTDRDR